VDPLGDLDVLQAGERLAFLDGVGILGAIEALLLVGLQALGDQEHEAVLRLEGVDQRLVVGRIRLLEGHVDLVGHLQAVLEHGVGQAHGAVGALGLGAVAVAQLGQRAALLPHVLGEAGGLEHLGVGEGQPQHLAPLLETGGGEADRDAAGVVEAGPADAGAEHVGQAALLQIREQAALALVAHGHAHQAVDLGEGVPVLGRDLEVEAQLAHVLDGDHVQQAEAAGGVQGVGGHAPGLGVTGGDRGEALAHHALQLVEAHVAEHGQGHVGRLVVVVEEGAQDLLLGVGQRLRVARGEAAGGVAGLHVGALELHQPPGVVHGVLLVLGVHRLHFPLGVLEVERGRDEELREPVQGLGQGVVIDLEVVVGVILRGVGVRAAAAGLEEVAVAVQLGVLLVGQEQHVLEEVGQAGRALGVAVGADPHGHGGRRRVDAGVGGEHDPEAVLEGQLAVGPLVLGLGG
jgi:hypothetical protein